MEAGQLMRKQVLFILSILALLIYPLSLSAQSSFSLSLDVDSAAGDQAVTSLNVSADQIVAIQIFGTGIQNANGLAARFEYDASQIVYEDFDVGDVLPNAQALPERGTGFVEIGIASLGGRATADGGLVGTVRFRATAAFSGTAIRLVRAELSRGGQFEIVTLNTRVELPFQSLTSDFDGDGRVGFADFLAFAGQFGACQGDGRYEAQYDLDSDGAIGFGDFLLFSNSFGKEAGGGSEETQVTIPDASLRAAIEAALGKASGALITRAEMASLTRLEASDSDIRDLTGLKFATGLTNLDLGTEFVSRVGYVNSNHISDFSLLSGLTNLTRLDLGGNSISDLSALSGAISGLPNLERLILDTNSISDVSAISGFTRLRVLLLYNNNISDLSPLSGLTNLEQLYLENNSISDVSSLSGLPNLEWLFLHSNSMSDVSSLSGLTSLRTLNLDNNSISNITPLSGLTSLTSLLLSANNISDISALSGLNSLLSLSIFRNNIRD